MVRINRVAVIGAGTMGHGIAQLFASAGLRVALTDSDADVLAQAVRRIEINIEVQPEHDPAGSDAAAMVRERITPVPDLGSAAAEADFIVEAVVENLEIKHKVLGELEAHCPAHAIIASTTSS